MNQPIDLQSVRNERGIALVSALLVVMLIAVVAAGFILMASGERSVSSNVQIARASLLSADAGVRVAQQTLSNQAKARLDSLALLWTGSGPIISSPATLFPAGAQNFNSTNPQFTATATVSFADSDLTPNAQSYNYRYVITSQGAYGAEGQRQVQSTGILRVSAERGTFADYLLLTHTNLSPAGKQVWFTSNSHMDGRVHTNGEMCFAFQPLFQDLVTSVNSKAFYWNGGAPIELNASYNGTADVPLFFGGFERNVAPITLPTQSYDQQASALGLTASGTQPTNSEINTALGLGAGAAPPPNGIYPVVQAGAMNGGIYVQGPLDQCIVSCDTLTNIQTYEMRQGTVTKTITVNRTANNTTVVNGASSNTYFGVPNGITFVNGGGIADLHGPVRVGGIVQPALARNTQMNFVATGDITIQGDLVCDDFFDATNVMGIFSSGGNVKIGTSAPDDMFLDAFVMASGVGHAFSVENYNFGAPRGACHLRGGVVEYAFGEFYTVDASDNLVSGYWRDFHYDRRGLIPPFYPTTNRFVANQPSARTLAWKEI